MPTKVHSLAPSLYFASVARSRGCVLGKIFDKSRFLGIKRPCVAGLVISSRINLVGDFESMRSTISRASIQRKPEKPSPRTDEPQRRLIAQGSLMNVVFLPLREESRCIPAMSRTHAHTYGHTRARTRIHTRTRPRQKHPATYNAIVRRLIR